VAESLGRRINVAKCRLTPQTELRPDTREYWEQLHDETKQQLYRRCLTLSNNNTDDAWELFQDVHLAVGPGILDGKRIEHSIPYLYKVARNIWYRRLRERRMFLPHDSEAFQEHDAAQSVASFRVVQLAALLKVDLESAMATLTPREIAMIRMRLEGTDSRSIATFFGSTEGAVNAKLHVIRAKLKQALRGG
jgi:RNA polymerase sigma factor (sigma-70 family)